MSWIQVVIALVISNQPLASRSSDFEITRAITPWIVLYSITITDRSTKLQRTFLTWSDIHVMVNWHRSKRDMRWPISRDHIVGSDLEVIANYWFSIGSRAHVKLTWCNQLCRIVRKPIHQSMFLYSFHCLCFVLFEINQLTQKAKQKPANLKTQIKNSNQTSCLSWVT